jgi:hypothetical protein
MQNLGIQTGFVFLALPRLAKGTRQDTARKAGSRFERKVGKGTHRSRNS